MNALVSEARSFATPATHRTNAATMDDAVRASAITLDTQDSSGVGRGVRLDFKGVPILYTPYISFPISDERKSGFLFPDFTKRTTYEYT